ncbi:hypothetical protein U1Q18_005825 [Sarracenia purpurea var. burkii]
MDPDHRSGDRQIGKPDQEIDRTENYRSILNKQFAAKLDRPIWSKGLRKQSGSEPGQRDDRPKRPRHQPR